MQCVFGLDEIPMSTDVSVSIVWWWHWKGFDHRSYVILISACRFQQKWASGKLILLYMFTLSNKLVSVRYIWLLAVLQCFVVVTVVFDCVCVNMGMYIMAYHHVWYVPCSHSLSCWFLFILLLFTMAMCGPLTKWLMINEPSAHRETDNSWIILINGSHSDIHLHLSLHFSQ